MGNLFLTAAIPSPLPGNDVHQNEFKILHIHSLTWKITLVSKFFPNFNDFYWFNFRI